MNLLSFLLLLSSRLLRIANLPSLILVCCCFISPYARSANENSPLKLQDAIHRALTENLGLKIERITQHVEDENVLKQEAQFDPTLTASARKELGRFDDTGDNDIEFRNNSDSHSYSAGISKKLATGAQVNAQASYDRDDNLTQDAAERQAAYSLSITQPLLRDFGSKVNQASIVKAKSKRREAEFRLKNEIFDQLQSTEEAYWVLADSYERRALRESNIKLAQDQLAEIEERQRIGMATELEVLQAKSNLARRNEEIIRAEQAISNAADNLMATLGSLDTDLSIENKPTVQPLIAPLNNSNSFQEVLSTALERNFNPAIQNEILKQLEQDRLLAENEKRPQVDLTLSSVFKGKSNRDSYKAYRNASNRQNENWGMEVGLSLPWGQRVSKANLRQVDYSIEKANLRLNEIRQELIQSVRTAWRSLHTAQEQLRAAKLVVQFQQATFDQEKGRYDEGLSSLRDVLESQRDLDNAILNFLDAQLSTVQSEIRLSRVEGTLLERHHLSWDSVL